MAPQDALKAVIAELGSSSELARRLGITPSAVLQWERAPASRCVEIAALVENRVTAQQLRPDIFGAPDGSNLAGLSDVAIGATLATTEADLAIDNARADILLARKRA